MKKYFFITFSLFFCSLSYASTSKAKVIFLEGKAYLNSKKNKITLDQMIPVQSSIITDEKSSVKILLDDTSFLIKENSVVDLETFQQASLKKGAIRAKIAKNIFDAAQDKNQIKFLLKTSSAIMGVRGTEFLAIFSPEKNVSSVVTFEGEVAISKFEGQASFEQASRILMDAQTSHIVKAGTVSLVLPTLSQPTIPVKISPTQFHILKSAQSSLGVQPSRKNYQSIIPPNASAKTLSNTPNHLQEKLQAIDVKPPSVNTVPPEGMIDPKNQAIAPPAGGYINLQDGTYIAPSSKNAVFDEKTQTYTPTDVNIDLSTGNVLNPKPLNKPQDILETLTPLNTSSEQPRFQNIPELRSTLPAATKVNSTVPNTQNILTQQNQATAIEQSTPNAPRAPAALPANVVPPKTITPPPPPAPATGAGMQLKTPTLNNTKDPILIHMQN